MPRVRPATPPLPAAALLQLMWLASPALPVGGFSYSEGLEAAVEAGLVRGEAAAGHLGAAAWIGHAEEGATLLFLFVLAESLTRPRLADLYERRVVSGVTTHIFYVPSPDGILAQVQYSPANGATAVTYVHRDMLGSGSVITESGAVSQRLFYEPFGKRINADGVLAKPCVHR